VTTLDLRHVRAIVTDANVLAGLEPTAVAAYLQRTGWFQAHERETGIVWTRWIGEGAVKVFVPNDPTFADYAIRMGEVLAALARAEDRSQLAVLADLCAAMSDYRAAAPGEEAGAAGRTDWMEAEYGLRRPELALVLDLAACRIERETFVRELERLDWPRTDADELADLVCACEELAAESAPAPEARQADAGSPSIALIAAERQRQVDEEGWTPEHDDQHDREELALAAARYALPARHRGVIAWPWEMSSWRPTPRDRVRELVKAGALIAAAIDRLLRETEECGDGLG